MISHLFGVLLFLFLIELSFLMKHIFLMFCFFPFIILPREVILLVMVITRMSYISLLQVQISKLFYLRLIDRRQHNFKEINQLSHAPM